MVALVGLILTVLGSRLVASCRAYALSLEGGSVGVMYLAVFGSLFYDLVPVPFGFTLLALLASTAAFLAVVQNAQSLAVLGFLGGFLAPFFATDGPGDPVLWLSYYLILNLGIAVIAWSKAWRPLNLLGFWFTLGLGASWGTFSYLPELGVSEFFLASFFLLYLSMGVLYAFRQPPKLKGLVGGTLVFGSPLAVLYAQRVLMAPFEFGLAWSAFGLAALYLALAWALGRFAPPTLRTLAEAFAMLGIGFATLTLPFAFETSLTGNGWALEGAALVWIGLRQRRLWLRASGVALQLDCRRDVFCRLCSQPDAGPGRVRRAFISCFGFDGGLLDVQGPRAPAGVGKADKPGHAERRRHLVGRRGVSGSKVLLPERYAADVLLLFFTLTALLCILLSKRLWWPALALLALALLPLMGVFVDYPSQPLGGLGAISWPLALVAFGWILQRIPEQWPGLTDTVDALRAAHLWLFAVLLGLELTWQGGRIGPGWAVAGYGLAFAAVVFVVARPATRTWPG